MIIREWEKEWEIDSGKMRMKDWDNENERMKKNEK